MAEKNLTTKAFLKDLPGKICRTSLADALGGPIVPLRAFYELIHSDEYDSLSIVFEVLLHRAQAELDKLAEALTASLGSIEIELACEMIRKDGQTFHQGDPMRAIIE